MAEETRKGLPIMAFGSSAELDAWLGEQPDGAAGAWFRFARKGADFVTVSKAEAIETAIRHGWIDGQLDRYDEQSWLIRFTPRGPRSNWSQVNRATAERLMSEGRMRPRGQEQVDRARQDGRWERAYAPQSRAEPHPDLKAALDASPRAKAFFETLRGANRYAVIYRVAEAKTDKTRAARIARFVDMLEKGETLHPPKAKT